MDSKALMGVRKSDVFTAICACVIKHAQFENIKNRWSLYQKVISYISTHYTEDIKLAQIAIEEASK